MVSNVSLGIVSNVSLAMASNVHLTVSSSVFNLKRITGMPKYLPVSHHYLECFLDVSGADVCRLFGIHLDELRRAINWHGLLFWPQSQLVVDAEAETKRENEAYYRECRMRMLMETNGRNKALFSVLVDLWRFVHPDEQSDPESVYLLTWRECGDSFLKEVFDSAGEERNKPFQPTLTDDLLNFGNVHLTLDLADTSDYEHLCGLYE